LIASVKKITNVALVIADPFSKKIWAGVPPLTVPEMAGPEKKFGSVKN
jgi:hypothetical protein